MTNLIFVLSNSPLPTPSKLHEINNALKAHPSVVDALSFQSGGVINIIIETAGFPVDFDQQVLKLLQAVNVSRDTYIVLR